MADIMTAKEAAEKWGIAPRRVNELIRSGRILGAYKIGAAWVMPTDTQKPADGRLDRWKKKARQTQNKQTGRST